MVGWEEFLIWNTADIVRWYLKLFPRQVFFVVVPLNFKFAEVFAGWIGAAYLEDFPYKIAILIEKS